MPQVLSGASIAWRERPPWAGVHHLTVVASAFLLQASPPTMSAEGVHLRTFDRRHVGLLVRASHDPEIVRWTFIPPDLDQAGATALAERWLSRAADGRLRQYVVSGGSRPAVGLVSLVLQDPADAWLADVVYWLLPEGRHRGLVTGAVRLLLRWAFEQGGVRRVALYTKEGNLSSDRVAERSGFRYTGTVQRQRGEQELTLRRWLLDPAEHAFQPYAGH
jgi:RimJ/RimL family protein N-acetyltransferase